MQGNIERSGEPADDRYAVQIRDGLYRGRENFVYRLLVGEIPFVTSVFPLGAAWDERTSAQRVLVAASEVRIDVKEPKGVTAEVESAAAGLWGLRLKSDAGKVPAGARGNLLLYAFRLSTPPASKDNPNPKPWRSDYGYLPALPYVASGKP